MAIPAFASELKKIETQIARVSDALVGGDLVNLETAADDLRALVVSLTDLVNRQALHGTADLGLKARMACVSSSLAALRDGLSRLKAPVDLALVALVPTLQTRSYANGSAPYSSGLRQTGAFKVLAA